MHKLAFPFEFKSIDDAGLIEGIAAGIGNVDLGGDRILPGAFTKTLDERGGRAVPMLLHHNLQRPVGSWSSFTETPDGLLAKGRITLDAIDGKDAHALARDGALAGLSIGYDAVRERQVNGVRELQEVKLYEVSLVSVPMNEKATVTRVKTMATVRDLEDLLREEAGMSGRKAKLAAAAAWKAINQPDDDAAATAELAAMFNASAKRLGLVS